LGRDQLPGKKSRKEEIRNNNQRMSKDIRERISMPGLILKRERRSGLEMVIERALSSYSNKDCEVCPRVAFGLDWKTETQTPCACCLRDEVVRVYSRVAGGPGRRNRRRRSCPLPWRAGRKFDNSVKALGRQLSQVIVV